MRLLLDTGVALRHGFVRDQFQTQVHQLLPTRATTGEDLVIAPQVLFEFWVVVTRPTLSNRYGMAPNDAAQEIRKIISTFMLLNDPDDLLETWLQLCEKYQVSGKPAHDARLVAFMLCHGIDGIITLNAQDFSRFREIQVFVP